MATNANTHRAEFIKSLTHRIAEVEAVLAEPPDREPLYLVTLDGTLAVVQSGDALRLGPLVPDNIRAALSYDRVGRKAAEGAARRWNEALSHQPDSLNESERHSCTVEVKTWREVWERRLTLLREMKANLESLQVEGGSK